VTNTNAIINNAVSTKKDDKAYVYLTYFIYITSMGRPQPHAANIATLLYQYK
jgi:hypothetical protein